VVILDQNSIEQMTMIFGIDLLLPKGLYVYFGILELINNLLISSHYFAGDFTKPRRIWRLSDWLFRSLRRTYGDSRIAEGE
jgi:hypothetical protein